MFLIPFQINTRWITHVGKYDRTNDRPKLAMLAIDIGPMIYQVLLMIACLFWLNILAPESLSIIGRELPPELSRRPFEIIMILIMTIKFKT